MSKRKTPITEEAQPKPTAELRREGRLTRIAKALASGATVTDIAEAEGIGRTLASREANSPECRQLIAEFVGDEWQEMRAVFYRSMRAIEHALSARREYLTKDHRPDRAGQRRRLGHHHRRPCRPGTRVARRRPRTRRRRASPSSAPSTSPSSSTHRAPPGGRRASASPRTAWPMRPPRRGTGMLTKEDLQFLWLPLGARVRQDARRDRPPDRVPHRRRRPRREDRRPHRRHPADLHGRAAAHLREGLRPGRAHDRQERGLKKKLIHWALKVGPEMRDVQARGEEPSSGLRRKHHLATSSCCTRCRSASAAGSAS